MKQTSLAQNAIILALLLLIIGSAFGQTTNLPPVPTPLPELGASLLRVIASLSLVVGIFLGGVWCFKNWQNATVKKEQTPKLNILKS